MTRKINERFWILISRVLVTLGIVGMIVFLMSIFLARDPPIEIASVKLSLPVSLGFIALSASILAIGLSISSDVKMKALTSLNFYEKMAMMEGYKMDLHCGNSFKLFLNKCQYDIKAESALKPWADEKNMKKLMESITQIIECAQKKNRDANGAYTEDICDLIKIALEVDPKNKVLLNLKSKCPPFLANRKEVKNE